MPTIYIVLDVGLQHFHGKIVTSFRFPPLTQGGSLLMDQMVSTHTPSQHTHPHTLTTPSQVSRRVQMWPLSLKIYLSLFPNTPWNLH